jgi:hypothetical protein
MAEKWSINIRREHDGQITFTPDVPGAGKGQPLGVNAGDNVTWNNHTDQEIILKTIYPKDKDVFLCDPIPTRSSMSRRPSDIIGFASTRHNRLSRMLGSWSSLKDNRVDSYIAARAGRRLLD